MTTSSPKTLREVIVPLREIIAFGLLGVAALGLLVALVNLIPTDYEQGFRPTYLVYLGVRPPGFLTLVTVVAPVLAALVATGLGEPVRRAKLIAVLALVMLGVTIFFGLIFELLLGFIGLIAEVSFLDGVKSTLLLHLPLLALAALAALVVFRIWQGMLAAPKPQAGWGGQPYPPQYGQPGYPQQAQQYGHQYGQQYGQQPPYGQHPQYGQPQQGQYGQQPQYGQPPAQQAQQAPQAQYGQPQAQQAQYGQPQAPHGQYGQQQHAQQPPAAAQASPAAGQAAAGSQPVPGQPVSGQPTPGQSAAGQPASGQPAAQSGGQVPGQPTSPAAGAVYGQATSPQQPAADADPDRTSVVPPQAGEPSSGASTDEAAGAASDSRDSGDERWRPPSA